MTQLIYQVTIQLQTNGDCSAFQLNFPENTPELAEYLREKFKHWGFPVVESSPNSIAFSTLAIDKESK